MANELASAVYVFNSGMNPSPFWLIEGNRAVDRPRRVTSHHDSIRGRPTKSEGSSA